MITVALIALLWALASALTALIVGGAIHIADARSPHTTTPEA